MKIENVALEELLEELEAMLNVCFEGETERLNESLRLQLPNGQEFLIRCQVA